VRRTGSHDPSPTVKWWTPALPPLHGSKATARARWPCGTTTSTQAWVPPSPSRCPGVVAALGRGPRTLSPQLEHVVGSALEFVGHCDDVAVDAETAFGAVAQAGQKLDRFSGSLQDEREDPDLSRDPAQLDQGREVPQFLVVGRPGEEQVRVQGQVEGAVSSGNPGRAAGRYRSREREWSLTNASRASLRVCARLARSLHDHLRGSRWAQNDPARRPPARRPPARRPPARRPPARRPPARRPPARRPPARRPPARRTPARPATRKPPANATS